MSEIRLRPFEPEDQRLESLDPLFWRAHPVFGLTAVDVETGLPVGYAGAKSIGGRWWIFFHGNQDVRRPVFLHRTVKRWLAAAESMGMTPIYALCDMRYPRASEWLAALGFTQHGNGIWMRCQAQNR